MREGHEEPPADVRSFLPRPGEPVELYAERLRALHRDLTLVLQAVERGLAEPHAPEPGNAAAATFQPAAHAPPPARVEDAVASPTALPETGGARVEVVPGPSGAHGRAEHEPDPHPQSATSASSPAPAPGPAPRRRATDPAPEPDPRGAADPDARRPLEPFPARPSDRRRHTDPMAREPAWVETEGVPPPRFAIDPSAERTPGPFSRVEAPPVPPIAPSSPRPARGPRVPPLLLALMVTGWLLVAALALALVLDGA